MEQPHLVLVSHLQPHSVCHPAPRSPLLLPPYSFVHGAWHGCQCMAANFLSGQSLVAPLEPPVPDH